MTDHWTIVYSEDNDLPAHLPPENAAATLRSFLTWTDAIHLPPVGQQVGIDQQLPPPADRQGRFRLPRTVSDPRGPGLAGNGCGKSHHNGAIVIFNAKAVRISIGLACGLAASIRSVNRRSPMSWGGTFSLVVSGP